MQNVNQLSAFPRSFGWSEIMASQYRAFRGIRPISGSTPRLRPEMKLGELVERWAVARHPCPKTYHGARRAVRQLTSLVGDLGIGAITHVQLFDFRDALAIMPCNLTRYEREQPFAILVAWFKITPDDRPKVAATTIGKALNFIQSLIGFAYGERWVENDDVHNIPVGGHFPFQRRPFTFDEVARLFSSPLFVQPWLSSPERPHQVSNETVRWLMLLGFMTGARLEELGQLHVADVQREEGISFLAITETVYGGKADKSLKSPSSRRRVPIHGRLIDIGFLRFVERRLVEGEQRLFPDLERDRFERYTASASRRCNTIIDRVSRDRALVFHSFRHLFKDMCRSAGILESVNDQLTGHLPYTVGARYGRGVDLAALAMAIGRINVEFVDWEPVLRAA